jgi:hypothetical protein
MWKSVAPVGLLVVAIGLGAWTVAGGQERLPAPKSYNDIVALRAQLKIELKLLLKDVGPEHPKVLAIKSQLDTIDEMVREDVKLQKHLATRASLMMQFQKLLTEFGPEHPKVKDVKQQLDVLNGIAAQEQQAGGARYAVAGSSQNVVLLDAITGETWYLQPGKDGGEPAWAPLKRKE